VSHLWTLLSYLLWCLPMTPFILRALNYEEEQCRVLSLRSLSPQESGKIFQMKCPECNSTRLVKFGKKFVGGPELGKRHRVQQYQCNECGRITIYPREESEEK